MFILRYGRTFVIWACFAAIIACSGWVATFSPSYRQCVADHASHKSERKADNLEDAAIGVVNDPLPLYLRCEGIFLDQNSVLFTALFTLVIAAFTVSLARIGRGAERNFTQVERAFVYLTEIQISPGEIIEDNMPLQFSVQPTWRNSGKTPTKNLLIRANWTTHIGDLPADFPYDYTVAPIAAFLGPGAENKDAVFWIPGDAIADTRKANTNVFMWMRVDYQDIFRDSRPHFTEFCFRVFMTGTMMSATIEDLFPEVHWNVGRTHYGPRNRSDEDA
jgi:hypothetical protein